MQPELSRSTGGMVAWHKLFRKLFGIIETKAEHMPSLGSSNSTAKYTSSEMQPTVHQLAHIAMFPAPLFAVVPNWKRLTCPLTREWVNK